MIAQAQSLMAKHGDLQILDETDFAVFKLQHEVAEGFPDDYNLPDGTEYIRVTNYS